MFWVKMIMIHTEIYCHLELKAWWIILLYKSYEDCWKLKIKLYLQGVTELSDFSLKYGIKAKFEI